MHCIDDLRIRLLFWISFVQCRCVDERGVVVCPAVFLLQQLLFHRLFQRTGCATSKEFVGDHAQFLQFFHGRMEIFAAGSTGTVQ